jgi:hypothetical protein
LGKFGALWQGARLEPAIAAPADHAGQGLVVGSSQYFPRDAAPAKQAQAFDKTPDRTHAMIVRHQFLQADRTPLNLGTASPIRSRAACAANVSKSSSFSFPALPASRKQTIVHASPRCVVFIRGEKEFLELNLVISEYFLRIF